MRISDMIWHDQLIFPPIYTPNFYYIILQCRKIYPVLKSNQTGQIYMPIRSGDTITVLLDTVCLNHLPLVTCGKILINRNHWKLEICITHWTLYMWKRQRRWPGINPTLVEGRLLALICIHSTSKNKMTRSVLKVMHASSVTSRQRLHGELVSCFYCAISADTRRWIHVGPPATTLDQR